VYLLSRHPLYDVKAIRTPDRGVFGIWAVTVIDGKRFAVAAVHLSATMKVDPKHAIETERVRFGQIGCLMDFWRAQGSPPLIVAGDFNQLPFGPNYARMTADFTDGLASVGATDNTFASGLLRTRIDYVLHTPGWRATAGRVIDSDASDHRPVWLDLGPAR
jgi:endonuclease/exonuclease/phosphatase family metal-dependent hydrolase